MIFNLNLNIDFDELLRKLARKESVTSRFINLFENHDIHRNQIPEMFGHDLTLSDLADESSLLEKLNETALSDVCDLFRVRVAWLKGADKRVYDIYQFYKQPELFRTWLNQLKESSKEPLSAEIYLSMTKRWEEDAVLIIREQIAFLNNEPVYRMHICGGFIHKYWKARSDIAACIAAVLKDGIFIRGIWVKGSLKRFSSGDELPKYLNRLKTAKFPKGSRNINGWHPDRWVLDPKNFVCGVSDGFFGEKSALERWLDYEDKGLMETGYSNRSASLLFKEHLVELTRAK